MSEIVARCGFRCDTCMAYEGNNHSDEDQVKVAAAWSKYFGLNMAPEKLRCEGCWGESCPEKSLPDPSCPIRACVIEKGMNTCADCFDFPCETLDSRMKEVEEVIKRFKGEITHAEFDSYIAPYDARKTLNELRDRRTEERAW